MRLASQSGDALGVWARDNSFSVSKKIGPEGGPARFTKRVTKLRVQKISFKPSCTARLPPEPITGLAAATSGVAQAHPNGLTEGSLNPKPFCPPYGLARLGWLKTLNNSPRNWALKRSPRCQFFASEKSTLRKPLSEKVLRPMLPNCPKGGGSMMEFPST